MSGSRSSRAYARSFFALAVACLAVIGVITGIVIAADMLAGSDQHGPPGDEESDKVPLGHIAVVHNPPLIYEVGKDVPLEFDLVCEGEPCGPGEATLWATGADGIQWQDDATVENLSFGFVVPASMTDQTSFDYRMEVTLADGHAQSFPADGGTGTMGAVAIDGAQLVKLPSMSEAGDPQLGEVVVSGTWGDGEHQFGRSAESGSGPRSFDVAADGTVVIVDRYNDRFVRVAPDGKTTVAPAEFDSGENDIAIEPDGTIDLLYASGGWDARLVRFAPTGGKEQEEIALSTSTADSVRRTADTIVVEGADSWWFPVSRGGELLDVDQQAEHAAPGLSDDDSLVVRKHLRERGNEVWIAERTGSQVRAWQITGTDMLGPIDLAAPLPDGRVAVVQSLFSNDDSQLVVLLLGGDSVEQFAIPDEAEADMYVRVRLVDGALYQARTTKSGYSIWRYNLTDGQQR